MIVVFLIGIGISLSQAWLQVGAAVSGSSVSSPLKLESHQILWQIVWSLSLCREAMNTEPDLPGHPLSFLPDTFICHFMT